MKLFSRLLTFGLATLMCLSSMVSCGTSGDEEESMATTTTAAAITTSVSEQTTTAVETESPYDVNGYLKDTLDPTLNFNGEEVSILYWNDTYNVEFEVEQLSGDLVKDALYNRNSAVEERLGVDLVWTGTPGNNGNQQPYVQTVANDANSGGEYEIYAGYSMTAATLTLQGYTRDLMELDHLNFDMPWWPSSLTETTTIKDRLYFCSGDISTNLIHNIYCIFFNQNMASELNTADLYALVNDGKWTIDKMAEYGALAYSDLNGDATATPEDRFGIALTSNVYFDAFFLGAGLRTVSKDDEGNLVMAKEFSSDKTVQTLEKVINIFHHNNYAAATATLSSVDKNIFASGRTLFLIDTFCTAATFQSADSSLSYGVLPLPKLDETQENYATSMGFPYTLYSVSRLLSDEKAQIMGAVLECMASESHRQVTPALFELTMKLKYASGENDSHVYDLIRNSVYIDIGRVFCTPLNNLTYSLFRNACTEGQTNWASRIKVESKAFGKKLTGITQTLDELAAQ